MMLKQSISPRRSTQRSLSPEKSADAFLTTLKESRQAFDVFKDEAEKKGMFGKKVPLLHQQSQYYSKYIRNRNVAQDAAAQSLALGVGSLNRTSGDTIPDPASLQSERVGRNRVTQSIAIPGPQSSRRKPFVPLSDLLHRKHDDRVSEYLEKMKGLSIDEIVNTSILNKASTAHETGEGSPADKRELGLNGALSPLARDGRGGDPSRMSVGMTPKQVSIVEGARTKATNLAVAPTQKRLATSK